MLNQTMFLRIPKVIMQGKLIAGKVHVTFEETKTWNMDQKHGYLIHT